jgi:hypothetical protein
MANSNKHRNPDLVQKYRDENIASCEIACELGIDFSTRKTSFWPRCVLRIPAHDLHHIWGGSLRHDLWSNFCCIHKTPHILVHDGHKGQARYIRLLSMLAKAVKANRLGDCREFSLQELDKARGCSVAAWVEGFECESQWSWVRPYRDELMWRIVSQ